MTASPAPGEPPPTRWQGRAAPTSGASHPHQAIASQPYSTDQWANAAAVARAGAGIALGAAMAGAAPIEEAIDELVALASEGACARQ